MEHTPLERRIPGADTAVVLIHGICGTPRHFRMLLPLVPEDFSFRCLLLQGHGGDARAFGRASMAAWQHQVDEAVLELSQSHRRVLLVGHSLGSLLAMDAALRLKGVEGLFCMAVPLRLGLSRKMVRRGWQMFWGTGDPADPGFQAAVDCCGVKLSRNPFHYLGWIPRFLELFAKIAAIRRSLPRLRTPCICFQSAKDELVSPRSGRLLTKNPFVRLEILPASGHYDYPPQDRKRMQDAFLRWLHHCAENDKQKL